MFNENALQEIDQAVCSVIMGEETLLYSHPQHGFIDFCTGLSSLEPSKNINMRKQITLTWLKTDTKSVQHIYAKNKSKAKFSELSLLKFSN
jgi:hypothetical protein